MQGGGGGEEERGAGGGKSIQQIKQGPIFFVSRRNPRYQYSLFVL